MLRSDLKKKFLSSYFYSLIPSNPLKKLSARILPVSSFWTEGGFTLALLSEAWQTLDHFCNGNWIFSPLLWLRENCKSILDWSHRRTLSPKSYLTISGRFPTQVLSDLSMSWCIKHLKLPTFLKAYWQGSNCLNPRQMIEHCCNNRNWPLDLM